MSHPQVIWPWATKNWGKLKNDISAKFNSIAELDNNISTRRKTAPRRIINLFNKYYENPSPQFTLNHVLGEIIPFMQKLIIEAPKLFHKVECRTLRAGVSGNRALTRPQVATIISCMWFELFTHEYISGDELEHYTEPSLFGCFESQNVFALSCILNYFDRIRQYATQTDKDALDIFNAGVVIYQRSVLLTEPPWAQSDKKIASVTLGKGKLDDNTAKMQTVNSHEYIGGELFGKISLTHDEIILLTRPECLASLIYCPVLGARETLTILGAERISKYSGYGSSVQYMGDFVDTVGQGYSKDNTEVMAQCACIFIDASDKTANYSQFIEMFYRDLNKVYCGFSSVKMSPGSQIAVGNWTYGFNGTNMQLRFFQQLLAASLADKGLIYYSVDPEFTETVEALAQWLSNSDLTVGELFKFYGELMEKNKKSSKLGSLDLFECLYKI